MNIFVHEIKAYRKSTIIWLSSLIGMMVMFLSMFPTIASDTEVFIKAMEGYPEAVRKAFGIQLEIIGSFLGFYSYVFAYITLCGAIQAMNLGVSVVSKEVREKTADFLMTKPVSRARILSSKLMAALASITITNALYWAASFMMASQVATDDFSVQTFLMMSITLLFVQLIFLAIGVLVSVSIRKIKSVIAVSLGTVFTFYIIGMLIVIGEDGGGAKRYLTPFKYFDTSYILEHSRYEASFMVVAMVAVIVAVAASYAIYLKRDIHTV